MGAQTVKKILFVTLSNMGDVMLTLPVLDTMRALYPGAAITVMTGPRPKEIFEDNPGVDNLIIFDKRAPLRDKIRLFYSLKREGFDAVIDLKNSFFGAFLPARFRTSPFLVLPRGLRHMKERNLYRLCKALKAERFPPVLQRTFTFSGDDKNAMDEALFERGVLAQTPFLVVNPSAAGATRRWSAERFSELCARLTKRFIVVLTGSSMFKDRSAGIEQACASANLIDLTGKTTLRQLAYLCSRAAVVVSADTGVLHIASYMDAPLVGLFGAGDEKRYGPWSSVSEAVFKPLRCRPCSKAQCRYATTKCMNAISVDDVMRAVEGVLDRAGGNTKDV